jgi:hypothetical protein
MGIETALIVSAAVGAGSALFSGYTQMQAGDAQAKQAAADASAAEANGRLEAERIRKQASATKSSARAAAAENGLNVDTGVSTVINDQITQDSEYDAWLSILGAKNTSARLQADGQAAKTAGRNAMVGSTLQAGSSALSGYSGVKQWRSTQAKMGK